MMPPENTPDSFLVKHPLISGCVVALLLLLIFILWFYYSNNYIITTNNNGSPNTEAQAQEILQQQITELDKLRQETQTQVESPPITTTTQSQIKRLDILRSQTIQQTTTKTLPTPKTLEQQIKELDALRTQTK